VEKTVTTHSYGDLLPVMKVAKDLNLLKMLEDIVGEYGTIVLIMAINRVKCFSHIRTNMKIN
jgi:hypothetical protein